MAIKVRYEWRQLDWRWDENYTKQETVMMTPNRDLDLTNDYSEKADALEALDEALKKNYSNADFVLLEIYDRA
ncbi:hypothetical protein LU11_gp297 [Pseudomonas phage Lu11]|uniref:hypothetical protein n=1 Tax=Pseudomonas phage Lu11 TaxID=1161927 RepID=UPI00025F1853|nr:hypothetical protein LU11_gp297 [Pseudomonas phage Lu11]AFH14828.1 hypothetical protein Lu11_0290 [Pseudomonas phage Lu11]